MENRIASKANSSAESSHTLVSADPTKFCARLMSCTTHETMALVWWGRKKAYDRRCTWSNSATRRSRIMRCPAMAANTLR
ncbi:MAG: hypothetical protein NHB36_00040 [Nitrospira sp.]|nr:hypothetical protein [Nitrospira sp.]